MSAFVGGTGVGIFPNIQDEGGDIWREFGIGYQPAFILLKADGSQEQFGSLSEGDLQGHLDRLFS